MNTLTNHLQTTTTTTLIRMHTSAKDQKLKTSSWKNYYCNTRIFMCHFHLFREFHDLVDVVKTKGCE